MSGFQSRSIFKNAYRSDIIRTIIICGGFFTFLWFVEIIFKLSDEGTDFFFTYIKNPLLLPLNAQEFIYQPWSLFTYGFIEGNFWLLLTNMVWLWIFGTVIEDLRGINRVLPIFWFGGIAGGIVLLVVNNFYPLGDGLYLSTLGGVAAVAAATVTYKPKYIFYSLFNSGIPIYIFGIVFLVLTAVLRLHNEATILTFIVGGFVGFLSQNVLKSFFEETRNVLSKSRSYFSSNDNFIKVAKSKQTNKESQEFELNIILDKIYANGMESITPAERAYMEKYNH